MKLSKKALLTATFGAVMLFATACSDDAPQAQEAPPTPPAPQAQAQPAPEPAPQQSPQSNIVGVWGWELDDVGFQLHFNPDGSGYWLGLGVEFDWDTTGNELEMRVVGDMPAGMTYATNAGATI